MFKFVLSALLALGIVSSGAASTSAFGQTFAERAVDPNNPPPPLANEYGPQVWVDDGLNYDSLVYPTRTHTFGEGIAEGDVVGAFRMTCMAGEVRAVDPIVYPGGKGKSHPHQFYGNTIVNENSTYATWRVTGKSTCHNELNRSVYWVPALIRGDGQVVRPEYVTIYYKGFPKYRPQCTAGDPLYVGRCVGIPNNFRFIFGYDMLSGTSPTGGISWKCLYNGQDKGSYGDMVAALASCAGHNAPKKSDLTLNALAFAPGCWDGVNLDSANHRSHTSEFVTDDGNTGRQACPKTHPYSIPHFSLQSIWRLDDTIDFSGVWYANKPNQLHLSSDFMPGMAQRRPGSTYHADYGEGWNLRAKKAFQDNCIDKGLNCSQGDFGDGFAMKQDPDHPLTYTAGAGRLTKRPKMANEQVMIHVHAPQ